jgi:hypothetical protein
MPAKKPYVNYNMFNDLAKNIHGHQDKRKIVIHETVSHDHRGLSDIKSVSKYLGEKGYGIHCIVDQEGKSGYYPGERAVFWHAKGDNQSTIGIELVSYIPGLNISNTSRWKIWWKRERQLHKTARWLAYYSDKHDIPLKYSEGRAAGICSHWDISEAYNISGGHWDGRPKHRAGHFPMMKLIYLARGYKTGRLAYSKMTSFKLGPST